MTDDKCREEIVTRGHQLNPMKGIEGVFYRDDRKKDLHKLCIEVLKEKRAMINIWELS